MNIGIDIDDTINRLSDILPKYAEKFNKENNIDYDIKYNEWDFDKAFGWNNEDSEKFLCKYIGECFKNVKIKPYAKKYINKLKADGNKIFIITSRSENHCKDVYSVCENWLNKHEIKFDKLEIGWHDKTEPCKNNKIDIFIDDNLEVCNNIRKNLNIPILLFDSVYNKNDETFNRVFEWKEVYNEIKKIAP